MEEALPLLAVALLESAQNGLWRYFLADDPALRGCWPSCKMTWQLAGARQTRRFACADDGWGQKVLTQQSQKEEPSVERAAQRIRRTHPKKLKLLDST
jgi:hypothetical protein